MKLNICLLRGCVLAICLMATVTACSQEAKKPRIQTSANAKETVHKPQQEVKKVPAVKKTETVVKKKPVAKPKQAAAQKGKATPQKQKEKATAQKEKPSAQKGKGKPAANTPKEAKAGTAKNKLAATKPKPKGKQPETGKKKSPAASNPGRYIALKTNVPFLAVAVQNLAVEVQLHKHVSLDLPVMWSISDIDRQHALRIIALQPEARWWLKSAGTGHFFGVHAHVAWFNAKWKDDRYQTEKRPLMGAGISYGYQLPLSAHWGAEFNIGAGYANMQYNTYYNLENGAWIDTRTRHYWGITRAGVSLVYRF